MFDVIGLKTLYTILHLLGIALGVGGAFTSDALFFTMWKDRVASADEVRMMKAGSRIVWLGITLLFVSGLLLFSLNPAHYLSSGKFLAKMSIVLVITANGVFIHLRHLSLFERLMGVRLTDSMEFIRHSRGLFVSGALSATSWLFALVLGSWRTIHYSYSTIMCAYLVAILFGVTVALITRKQLLS